MTNEEILKLAAMAAQSAFDAHGTENMPPAEVAYGFVRQMAYEEADDDTSAQAEWDRLELTQQDWHLFRAAYRSQAEEMKGAL